MFISGALTGAGLVVVAGIVLLFSHILWMLGIAVSLLCLLSVYKLYRTSGLLEKEGLMCARMAAAVMPNQQKSR